MDNHKLHERSKSAISVESHGVTKQVDFHLHNHACEEKDKWFHDALAEKDHIIHDLEIQLDKKEEEVQYLVRQLDYLQTKYRQKKMQLSQFKNNYRSEESQVTGYGSKPERDIDTRPDRHN